MNKYYIDILRKKKKYQNCYIKLSKWCIKTNSVNIIGLRGSVFSSVRRGAVSCSGESDKYSPK